MQLIIAEKPIAAKKIADILGSPKKKKIGTIDVFELEGKVIVPLKGHALNVDFPKELNNWQKTKLSDLIDGKIEYNTSLRGIQKAIHAYSNASELIIATDFDREGESIGKEAIDIVRKKNKEIKIQRAKFSALTPSEVKNAFSNLVDFDYNLADAADTRREIDLIWGAVLTRYVSLTSGKLGKNFLSVGRVQTPALALVVDREKEIKAFKPEDYWALSIDCEKNNEKFNAVYEIEKLFDMEKAKNVSLLIDNKAIVKKIEKRKTISKPPTPFNTTAFMSAASNLGIQPKRAMSIAEKLYMEGFTSYPRTDNTHYPDSLDLREILKKFSKTNEFGDLAKKLLKKKKLTPTKGKKKTTDHPPIYPVEPANKKKLDSTDWRVYELIVKRFFATLSDESESETVKVVLDYKGENFIAKGKTVLTPGWREFYPYSKSEEQYLPILIEDEKIKVSPINSEQKQTKHKPRYSPAGLIKLMDDLNLGTKATRAEILQKLIDRGYVQGRTNFTPSSIGFAVIDALGKYSEDITKPKMTSDLEIEMDGVERGEIKKSKVVEDSRKMLHKVLIKLEANKEKIGDQLRTASYDDYVVGKWVGCGGTWRMIRTKRGTRFVGCSGYKEGCEMSFPLPARGKLVALHVPCKVCELPMIRVINKGMRPYEMCINHKCASKENWGKKKKEKTKEILSSTKKSGITKKAVVKKATKKKVIKKKTIKKKG